MALPQLSKLMTGVRFPLPAPMFLSKGSRHFLLKHALYLVAFVPAMRPFERNISACGYAGIEQGKGSGKREFSRDGAHEPLGS